MEKKQSSIEQIFSHIKASRNDIQYWNDSMLVDWLLEQEDRFKAMHNKEVISFAKKCLDKALDTDVRTAHSKVEELYNETFGCTTGGIGVDKISWTNTIGTNHLSHINPLTDKLTNGGNNE